MPCVDWACTMDALLLRVPDCSQSISPLQAPATMPLTCLDAAPDPSHPGPLQLCTSFGWGSPCYSVELCHRTSQARATLNSPKVCAGVVVGTGQRPASSVLFQEKASICSHLREWSLGFSWSPVSPAGFQTTWRDSPSRCCTPGIGASNLVPAGYSPGRASGPVCAFSSRPLSRGAGSCTDLLPFPCSSMSRASFLHLWLWKSLNASLQFVFSENCSTVDIFLMC